MTSSDDDNPEFVEGRDYTIENGRWVFTADYLKRRGYCCDNNCRHCPYPANPPVETPTSHKKEKEPRILMRGSNPL